LKKISDYNGFRGPPNRCFDLKVFFVNSISNDVSGFAAIEYAYGCYYKNMIIKASLTGVHNT